MGVGATEGPAKPTVPLGDLQEVRRGEVRAHLSRSRCVASGLFFPEPQFLLVAHRVSHRKCSVGPKIHLGSIESSLRTSFCAAKLCPGGVGWEEWGALWKPCLSLLAGQKAKQRRHSRGRLTIRTRGGGMSDTAPWPGPGGRLLLQA